MVIITVTLIVIGMVTITIIICKDITKKKGSDANTNCYLPYLFLIEHNTIDIVLISITNHYKNTKHLNKRTSIKLWLLLLKLLPRHVARGTPQANSGSRSLF